MERQPWLIYDDYSAGRGTMTTTMPTTAMMTLTCGDDNPMGQYELGQLEVDEHSGLAGDHALQTTGELPPLEADYHETTGDLPPLEVDFGQTTGGSPSLDGEFDMEASPSPKFTPSRPWHVILDFDGTITRQDTLDALVCQCILWNYEHVVRGGGRVLKLHQMRGTDQWKEWEWAKNEYLEQLVVCMRGEEMCSKFILPDWKRNILSGKLAEPRKPGQKEATIIGHQPDLFTEIELQEGRKPMEEFSIERLNATGIFDHVGADSILKNRAIHSDRHYTPAEIAESREFSDFGVSIRDGFADFTEELANRRGSAWGVVSVNWSRDWIEGIILRELWDKNEEASTDRNIPIMSNSLAPPPPPPGSLTTLVTAGPAVNGSSNGTGNVTGNGVQNGHRQPTPPGHSPEAARPPPRGIVGMGPPLVPVSVQWLLHPSSSKMLGNLRMTTRGCGR